MAPQLDRMSLAPHARRAVGVGLAIFAIDMIAYLALVYGAVAADALVAKVLLSLLAGVPVALLAIVGHDAAHHSFLPNKRLNELVGTVAFLPALHAYSLWEHHHNRVHHRYTAQIGLDNAYSPMTMEAYLAASPGKQRAYRFQRSLLGQQLFYMMYVWWPDIFMPFNGKHRLTRGNIIDLVIVYFFIATAVVGFGVISLSARPEQGVFWALADGAVFGLLIPFFVWNVFISFVTIVQHTGPAVRWILPTGQPSTIEETMAGTVHIVLPNGIDWLMHRVMQHQAHHVHVGVPLYRLKGAQSDVGDVSNRRNVQVWTPAYHWHLTQACKLYDTGAQCWRTFADAKRVSPAERVAA